jgi:cysteinyl-tRNA synthetase
MRYLGKTIDIHGGGQDLIFPHHENEIAQSESFTGVKPFVKYWMHNGLLQFGEEKMSKSLGNLITVRDALAKYSADAIRIFVLSSHYRSPLTYSEESLEAAERGSERLRQAVHSESEEGKRESKKLDIEAYRQRFNEAMDDDFNTPQAIATLFDLAREINRLRDEGYSITQGQEQLRGLASVLGLPLKLLEKPLLDAKPLRDLLTSINEQLRAAKLEEISIATDQPLPTEAEPLLEILISTRDRLRQAKQWHLADKIRAGAAELGIDLEDTPKGTVWKRKR